MTASVDQLEAAYLDALKRESREPQPERSLIRATEEAWHRYVDEKFDRQMCLTLTCRTRSGPAEAHCTSHRIVGGAL
jgi:hypothetical protein